MQNRTWLQEIHSDWTTTGPYFAVLLVLGLVDIVGGLFVAWSNGQVTSTISRQGFLRKVLVWFIVIAASICDGILPALTMPALGQLVLPTVGAFVSVIGITQELISILEKAALLGVYGARKLASRLRKVRETMLTTVIGKENETHVTTHSTHPPERR
jgi:toxin secretion/phage lysis holin